MVPGLNEKLVSKGRFQKTMPGILKVKRLMNKTFGQMTPQLSNPLNTSILLQIHTIQTQIRKKFYENLSGLKK